MSEWRTVTLGELAPGGIQSGPFGTQLHASDYVRDGVPLIMPKNIGPNQLRMHQVDRVAESDAARLSQHRVKAGDVVVGRKGELGRRVLVGRDEEGWLCGTDCIRIRPDAKLVHPAFLGYYFNLSRVSRWLHSRDTGSTMPNLNARNLAQLPVQLPPMSIQRAVASLLGGLDDKIRSNEALTDKLRKMSALQFEAALARGAIDGTVREVALRELSSGFRIVKTGPFGSVLHASDYADAGTPLILVKHVISGLILREGLPLVADGKAATLSEYTVKEDDLVVTRVGRVGDVAIVHRSQDGWLFSGQMLRVRVSNSSVEPYWLFGFMMTQRFREQIDNYAVGSTRQSLSVQLLEAMRIPAVGQEVQRGFAAVARPIWKGIEGRQAESEKLGLLRDALLPGLMSGEVGVRDADVAVTEQS